MVLVTTRYSLNSGISDPDGGDDILDAYNSSPKVKVRFSVVTAILCGMF
jgi:hypothetical protein